LIAHWPAVIKRKNKLEHQPGHVIDIMATCCDIAGAAYPKRYKGNEITALEGKSLLPREHEGNRAVRKGKWKLVSKYPGKWELYDMDADRTELNDLVGKEAAVVEELKAMYNAWAKRSLVVPWGELQKRKKPKAKAAAGKKGGQNANTSKKKAANEE